eukprot:362779-Chlamydomonas_euryale.AAC.2
MPTPSFSSADLASLPLKLQICSELLALRDRRTQVGFDACNSDSDSGRRPRVWALVQMSFSPLKQGPETRRWKSMAGRHEPLGARRHEPLGAGRHEPLGAGRHEPLGAGRHEPLGARRHEPLGAWRHEPLGAGRHEPLGASTCFLECQLSGMSANVNLPGGDPCGRHQRRGPASPFGSMLCHGHWLPQRALWNATSTNLISCHAMASDCLNMPIRNAAPAHFLPDHAMPHACATRCQATHRCHVHKAWAMTMHMHIPSPFATRTISLRVQHSSCTPSRLLLRTFLALSCASNSCMRASSRLNAFSRFWSSSVTSMVSCGTRAAHGGRNDEPR